MPKTQCDNCYKTIPYADLIPLEDVKDLGNRLDPGKEVPAGECKECGGLAYLKTEMDPQDGPESLPQESRVIHLTEGFTQEDGKIRVHNWTNDNEDRGYTGYSGDHATWEITCRDQDDFRKHYGQSRVGCLGAQVIVKLDGKEIRA